MVLPRYSGENNNIVALIGDKVEMGGGEIQLLSLLDKFIQEQVPPQCPGPYSIWRRIYQTIPFPPPTHNSGKKITFRDNCITPRYCVSTGAGKTEHDRAGSSSLNSCDICHFSGIIFFAILYSNNRIFE